MEDKKLFIPVVLGTGREGRKSEYPAHLITEELNKRENVEAMLVDAREHASQVTVPPWGKGGADEIETEWKRIVLKADALIIVTPEYNHGYPGELKILLDSLFDEYKGKPVGLCGVSKGMWGGTRVVEHIKPVLVEFSMIPIRSALYFPKVEEAFDKEGDLQDESARERVGAFIDALLAQIKN
ncbi:MAG: NADPH-dependent FMN reductase [Candidatus Paceibacterota bacterium]